MTSLYEKECKMYIDGLEKHLSAERILNSDDLTVVLKAHLFLEILLDQAIFLYHKNEKANNIFESLNVGFSKKIEIIEKYNLLNIKHSKIGNKNNIKILRHINKLRNEFAHNLTCELSQCAEILDAIFPHFEEVINKGIKDKELLADINNHLRFKFALCVFHLTGLYAHSLTIYNHFSRFIDKAKEMNSEKVNYV